MRNSGHRKGMKDHETIINEAARLVSEGVSVTLPVNGSSMLPFIIGGRDSVILQKPAAPRVGDVVLAWVDGRRYVVHRIIRIDGDGITLMGDGNIVANEHCTASDIKALATHIVDDGGNVRYLYTRRRRWMGRLWRWFRPIRKYLLPVVKRRKL